MGGTLLTRIDLQSTTGGTGLPFTVGQSLKQGDVPAGSVLVGDSGSVQFVVKNRWPDGSAKFAVLSGSVDLAANTWKRIGLSVAAAPTTVALLGPAELKATGVTAAIQFGSFGTASWNAGDWDTPTQTVVSGPEMSAFTYRKPIGTDAHLVAWLEVRLYKGGRVEVMPWIENGYLNVAGPTQKDGTASFTLGGTQRFSQALSLLNHQRAVLGSGTTLTHWFGSDPKVTPRHDTAYMMASKLVPLYRGVTGANSPLFARLPTAYTPLMQGGYPDDMGQPGYWPSIGVLPEWDVAYLTSQGDPRAYRGMFINALAAGRYGFHFRDEKTQRPLRFSSYPGLVLDGSVGVNDIGGSTSGQRTPVVTGLEPPAYDTPHLPSMGYMAYLVTGWNYFMEESQFSATVNYLKNGDATRQYAKGIFESSAGANTTRGAGWVLRTLAQAATITPDADPLKAEFANSLSENINYYHGRYVAMANNPLGLVQPYGGYGSSGPWQGAPWQEDFLTAAFGYAKDLQAHNATVQTKLDQFLAWKYRSVVGRLGGSGTDQFSYRYAAQYTVYYAPSMAANYVDGTGPWYNTWGEVARAMGIPTTGNLGEPLEVGYPTNPTAYWGNLMPALSFAVDHGAAGAADAWRRVTSASNFAQQAAGYNDDPVWGQMPRSATSVAPAPAAPSGWTRVVSEGQSYTLARASTVRYGAGSSWVTLVLSGSFSCTSRFFGRDPAVGVIKQCDVQDAAITPVTDSSGTWTKIASEGQALSVATGATVRYGVGTRWLYKKVTGAGACTSAFFGGDPASGMVKECSLLSTTPGSPDSSGWTRVASEGQSYTLTSASTVRYGAGSRWVTLVLSGSFSCTSRFFGRDPAVGVIKQCDVQDAAITPVTDSSGTWTKIASEGQAFAVSTGAQVRYGSGTRWLYRTVNGAGACTSTFFGGDPAAGIVKECGLLSGTSTPTVPTTIANLQPGQWLELPGTKIRSVLPTPPQPGFAPYLVQAWSGGTVDTRRGRLLVWGGGHMDYAGNEMYALDLATLSIQRIVEPSPRTAESSCTSALSDGTPASRHTYGGLTYIAHVDKFFATAGSLSTCGAGDPATWTYDFTGRRWAMPVARGPMESFYGTMAVYEPATRLVYVKDQGGFYSYNADTNVYTKLNTTNVDVDYHLNGTLDTKRRKLVMLGQGVQVVDVATGRLSTMVTTNAPGLVTSAQSPGVAYDPVADRIVAWHGGGQVWALNMDTGVWTQVATNAGPTAAAPEQGTFGRWGYIPQFKVFALINDIDQNAWVFKLAN